MFRTLILTAPLFLGILIQYNLYRHGLSPITLNLPELPTAIHQTATPSSVDSARGNKYRTDSIERIGINDLVGPESLVVHPQTKDLFAALGDGRIVRISAAASNATPEWTTVLRTGRESEGCGLGGAGDDTNTEELCGRPLGLLLVKRHTIDSHFQGSKKENALIVADAYQGLLLITNIDTKQKTKQQPQPQLRVLATGASTDELSYRFQLLNAVTQTSDGSLYITETSTTFQRRRIFYAAFDGRPTGRLLRYTKESGVKVVADTLFMPNGLTVSHDGESLLIVSGVRILRYSLGTQTMEEYFVEALPGTGDNIKAMTVLPTGESKRCYWVGLGSKYTQPFSLLKALGDKPILRSILLGLIPYKYIVGLIPKYSGFAVYNEDGTLYNVYEEESSNADDTEGIPPSTPWLSEAEPLGEYVYLASWFNPFLARVKSQDLV